MKNFIYNKSQVYDTTFTLYQYNDNNFRVVCNKYTKQQGFERIENFIDFIGSSQDEEFLFFETERVDLIRTKRNIREICLCNNFTHFFTLTINSNYCDRFSLDECQKKLKYIIKEKIRRKNKDFAYIIITEKHKDGAFHFHGLCKGLPLYNNKYGYLSSTAFDILGFNSFSPIVSYDKVCNYITKYITKNCVKNSHNQIYISSRGLKKATKYKILPLDLKWGFENEFCKIRDINLNNCDKTELLKILNIIEKK